MSNASSEAPDTPDAHDTPDEGPLIRLGEGIVVDWADGAFNTLFEGEENDNNFRGRSTYTALPAFNDTELTARRAARARRRNNGITLDDCLNEFGKEEILSEADTCYCPRCKEASKSNQEILSYGELRIFSLCT